MEPRNKVAGAFLAKNAPAFQSNPSIARILFIPSMVGDFFYVSLWVAMRFLDSLRSLEIGLPLERQRKK